MHASISVATPVVIMFTCKSFISSSLSSLWFCLDSQSDMYRSHPGLYMMLTVYRCIFSTMHCSLCDVAMCFSNTATSGLWSVIICTSLAKQ